MSSDLEQHQCKYKKTYSHPAINRLDGNRYHCKNSSNWIWLNAFLVVHSLCRQQVAYSSSMAVYKINRNVSSVCKIVNA